MLHSVPAAATASAVRLTASVSLIITSPVIFAYWSAAAAKSVQTLNRGYRNQDDFSVVDEEQVGPFTVYSVSFTGQGGERYTNFAVARGKRLLRSFLYGVGPGDPLTVAAALAGLVVVALAASLLPAYRATAVDPMVALRAQ